ncbi:hypothetical protein B296_00043471 [Ensete ventricosum]|uniref:Uncharacterized protein n=1 Tax=Ensete ventricosum TaxID=4639 RepID=A0A426X3P0_ENSVE|nr:hypothetical protein B296_00043471 [Ensete ventricosum]
MFNLERMKSSSGGGSESVVPSTTSASATATSTIEKRPNTSEGVSLKKHNKKEALEQPADALESTTRAPAGKGNDVDRGGPQARVHYTGLVRGGGWVGVDKYFASIMTRLKTTKGEDPLARWSTISESTQVWTDGPLAAEYLRGALHPALAKQVYECSSVMNRVGKSTVWVNNPSLHLFFLLFFSFANFSLYGLHFLSALIDRIHDVGQLVRHQHERILALWATNKGLKVGASQELVAIVERRAKELKGTIEKLRAELESLRSQWKDLEQEVNILHASLDGAQDDRALCCC